MKCTFGLSSAPKMLIISSVRGMIEASYMELLNFMEYLGAGNVFYSIRDS
jgi:hypothetical protein